MRGKLSADLIKILSVPEGREEIEKALKTGRTIVTIGNEQYELTVVGRMAYEPDNQQKQQGNHVSNR